MKKTLFFSFLLLLLAVFAMPENAIAQSSKKSNDNFLTSPPPAPYVNVSKALKGALPNFIPGLGTLYVDASKLPEGPFLAYDKAGKLIKIVFMIPLEKLQNQTEYLDKAHEILAHIGNEKVDHINFIYSGPHPGVTERHYHIELVLVSAKAEKKALGDNLY